MKRPFLSIVSLLLVAIMLVACAGPSVTTTSRGESQTTTAPSTTDTSAASDSTVTPVTTKSSYVYKIPDYDLDGAEISFVIAGGPSSLNYRSIVADDGMGDTVDQAIYERTERIMNALNCEIYLYEDVTSDYSILSRYGDQLLAGDPDIDVISGRQYTDVHLSREGYMQDLTELKEYLHWEGTPYWDEDYINGMNYKANEHVYLLTGDLSLYYTGGFYTSFVNASLYELSCKETYGNIYDLVYNGDWTYETITEMSKLAWQDIGNEQDKTDGADILGAYIPLWDNANAMAISAGISYSTVNPDGSITMNITDTNSTLVEFAYTVAEFFKTNGVISKSGSVYSDALARFASDNAMIVFGRLHHAESHLRNMESDYYILPYPKLNKAQSRYYSSLHDALGVYGINKYSNEVRESAIVLDAMAGESYVSVRPEYYDFALQYKYTRGDDDSAAKMIDFIASCATSDPVYVWCFSDEYLPGANKLGDFFRNKLTTNAKSIVISAGQRKTLWQNGTNAIIEDFEAMWAKEE